MNSCFKQLVEVLECSSLPLLCGKAYSVSGCDGCSPGAGVGFSGQLGSGRDGCGLQLYGRGRWVEGYICCGMRGCYIRLAGWLDLMWRLLDFETCQGVLPVAMSWVSSTTISCPRLW